MALAPTPCLETGCREHATYQGRCPTHKRPPYYGSTRRERLPRDWSTRRQVVLRRDKGICYICGGINADTVDHLIAGDDHSLENLRAVHDRVEPHCHRQKTAQEGNDALKGQRFRRRH
jgi:5-methylcytosine-specific restriction protein A